MAGPLKGVKILDLSRVLAGPWAGQLFADLGADVIKVERPGTGDDTRSWGPPFAKDEHGADTQEAGYYLSTNRGKRSIAVDIHDPEGQKIIRRLAQDTDIVIENFKQGGLEKYGLDYASLKAVNKGIIYLSITGFGQTGPYAHRAGYDLIIQAMGGLMSITGERDDLPGGGPQKVGVAVTDLFTGLYGVIGALAALHHRSHSGEGQHIDMALLDTVVSIISNQHMLWLLGGQVPQRMGNAHATIVPYQSFATEDGHLALAVGNDRQFRAFAAVAGDDRLKDAAFATNPERVRNRDHLIPIIDEIMLKRSTMKWADDLEAVGVPAGPINSIDRVFADPHVKARGLLRYLDHPLVGEVPSVMNPIRFSGLAGNSDTAPPTLGQHSDDILRDAGFDAAAIKDLRARGVIA